MLAVLRLGDGEAEPAQRSMRTLDTNEMVSSGMYPDVTNEASAPRHLAVNSESGRAACVRLTPCCGGASVAVSSVKLYSGTNCRRVHCLRY